MNSLFKSTNLSSDNTLSLTDRVARKSSIENIDLNSYLVSLQTISETRDLQKKVFKQFMHSKDKIRQLRSSMFATSSNKEIHSSTTNQQVTHLQLITRNRFKSQRSTILNRQSQLQEQYDDQNQDKIQQLDESILQLINSILKLKEAMNNNKKLYFKIQRLIGLKKTLQKMLLNTESQSLTEPLTLFSLKQNIAIKEHIIDSTSHIIIDTFNFNIIREINLLAEKIEQIFIQSELKGIKQLENKITDEIYTLKVEQNKLKIQQKRIQSPKLKFQQRNMRNQQFLEGSLELVESRLGQFPLILQKNRIIHFQLQNVINGLNTKFQS